MSPTPRLARRRGAGTGAGKAAVGAGPAGGGTCPPCPACPPDGRIVVPCPVVNGSYGARPGSYGGLGG